MTLNIAQMRQALHNFDFKTLFIDHLGWDRHSASHEITVDEKKFSLCAVAQKRGVVAFLCDASNNGGIPDYQMRKRIERVVEKSHHEHLIVFVDERAGSQIWQWVKRELGKPVATREHAYHRSQPGDALIQKLQNLAFSIEDEENLTIIDVTGRLRGFDVERVTKRFYDQFKTEHAGFTKFIQGIPDESLQSWYASFMLDRLMFIYFVQKKNFLDGDPDYLRTKLEQSRKRGVNRYYREFLCCLFFEGFAKKERERSPAVKQLLGKVPYLNGGLFLPHQIEEQYGDRIHIADTAFVKLYDFFGQWHWHLDERPLRNDREINPDVLGYIFEKYVNQKQMGAYYTKEDITEYIGKNTIIPFLFDAAEKRCPSAFKGEKSVWRLLQEDPDRYIYNAVKHGITVNIHEHPPATLSEPLSLPAEIAAGIGSVPKRTEWNKPAPPEFALPTEIWREVVARRQRYEEVRGKMARGEIQSINDLITYNLNIRQFAQDVIVRCDDPELLHTIYQTIEKLTVLDPTCGSGAFLFAALNILEPLYEACLDRMEAFLRDGEVGLGLKAPEHQPKRSVSKSDFAALFDDFRQILSRVAELSNRRYFILKAIIVNNLFGVDIMEEAVEICKLRLFLKLAAQAERDDSKPNWGIEPLPDIDFNIRAGNTLVGFATHQEVKDWITLELKTGQYKMRQLLSGDALERIETKAQTVDNLFASFRQQQTEDSTNATPVEKKKLQKKLGELRDELNRYLAAEYGIDHNQSSAYDKWLKSHKPFHWFVEFYGVMKSGGFDVIIGNPPYVEYSKVKEEYFVRGYNIEKCGNLYAFTMERSQNLLRMNGRHGMILPLSSVCTDRMEPLQKLLLNKSDVIWCSMYAERPNKLFVGVEVQLSIILARKFMGNAKVFTTRYNKWEAAFREHLFESIAYQNCDSLGRNGSIPKIGSQLETDILNKIVKHRQTLTSMVVRCGEKAVFYRNAGGRYYKVILNFEPPFKLNGRVTTSSTYCKLPIANAEQRNLVCALMNSNLFFWYWIVFSDTWHMIRRDIEGFPVGKVSPSIEQKLIKVCEKLMEDLQLNSIKRQETRNRGKDTVEFVQFVVRNSKPIIDEIDRVLAQHYGFTDEELDFIINYDIKYRMGNTAEEE